MGSFGKSFELFEKKTAIRLIIELVMISELLWRINFAISISSYGHDCLKTCLNE